MISGGPPTGHGDAERWRALVDALRPFVARRVAAGDDADDVLQEILLRIQRGLPQLRDEQRFGPWVYRIARSAIADHLRAWAKHPHAGGDATDALAAPDPADDANGAIAPGLSHYAAQLVATLPSPYREALTLTELEGLSQVAAARMLGLSTSGMKSRVQRGRRQLREALDDCCRIALDARRRVVECEPRAADRCCPPGAGGSEVQAHRG